MAKETILPSRILKNRFRGERSLPKHQRKKLSKSTKKAWMFSGSLGKRIWRSMAINKLLMTPEKIPILTLILTRAEIDF